MSTLPETPNALVSVLVAKGSSLYGGEAVMQIAHALQAARLAEFEGRPASEIVAALLHDIGHIFESGFEQALDTSTDGRHERIGEAVLKRWFGPAVTEPVRLHVAAKRYLCATKPDYIDTLSRASLHSLALQGGPMTVQEIADFEAEPYHRAAVQVRIYDDLAKDAHAVTPDMNHFMRYVESVCAEQ